MFRDWLLMSSAPQKVALEQNTGYMFLLSNGLMVIILSSLKNYGLILLIILWYNRRF